MLFISNCFIEEKMKKEELVTVVFYRETLLHKGVTEIYKLVIGMDYM